MATRSNATKYKNLYDRLEFEALQRVRNSSIGQQGRDIFNDYKAAGKMAARGSIFKGVDTTMKAMGRTATWCKNAVVGVADNTKYEQMAVKQEVSNMLMYELQKPDYWTMCKRRTGGNVGWLCKPQMSANVPDTLTGMATGIDYYLYFENRVRPVNVQELSFDFEFVQPNGTRAPITMQAVAKRMGINSQADFTKANIVRKVMPWEKVQLKAEAELSDKYNYVAFYIYPSYVSSVKNLNGFTQAKESSKANMGLFLLLPEQYFKHNSFDLRAMRVVSPSEYVALFYKGEFEWCLQGVQPSVILDERPRQRRLTQMVQKM